MEKVSKELENRIYISFDSDDSIGEDIENFIPKLDFEKELKPIIEDAFDTSLCESTDIYYKNDIFTLAYTYSVYFEVYDPGVDEDGSYGGFVKIIDDDEPEIDTLDSDKYICRELICLLVSKSIYPIFIKTVNKENLKFWENLKNSYEQNDYYIEDDTLKNIMYSIDIDIEQDYDSRTSYDLQKEVEDEYGI